MRVGAQHSRGVALITVLLVVALATVAAVSMLSRQQVDVRRTANVLHYDQANLYARGIEGWASQVLRRDREDGEVDTLDEDWATILPPMEVEGGQLTGAITDLQGRFNINSLLQANGEPDELAVARFQRLLQALNLEPELAQVVLDWLDEDVETRFPGGGEDEVYTSREQPYRTGNTLMASVSELRAVAGFDTEVFEAVRPHVAALPGRTPINVNTATVAVLMSLADEVSEADAERLVELRGEEGFKSLSDFRQSEPLAGRDVAEQGLSVGSDYFLVSAVIKTGRVTLRHFALLWRGGAGEIRVIRRSQGSY